MTKPKVRSKVKTAKEVESEMNGIFQSSATWRTYKTRAGAYLSKLTRVECDEASRYMKSVSEFARDKGGHV